jgi:hypothetical protein
MGTAAKNAPSVSAEIPPKHSTIPPIIVRIAIIVIPVGLSKGCVNLPANYFSRLNKRNL